MRPEHAKQLAVVCGLLVTATFTAHAEQSLIAQGHDLYQLAQRIDASPIIATAQGDVPLSGANAACVNCHRRSGLGTAEGAARSLPITANALFQDRTGAAARPAYTDETLARALTTGVTPDGRTLNRLMPRYQLSAQDAAALTAYLRTLGATAAPGLSANEIVLATIIADDAPAAQRAAVEQVLQRFVAIKNSGSRRETERAAAANRHPFGERRDRAYRAWQLAVWRLHGPTNTWRAQLQRYYAEQPAFAVVSGATGHDWQIVHDFCELQQLPCILPLTDLPPDSERGFYSLYYTAGVRLEASITAQHLLKTVVDPTAHILLLHDDSERSRAARQAFVQTWQRSGRPAPDERVISGDTALSRHDWPSDSQPGIVIAWLDDSRMNNLAAMVTGSRWLPQRLYTAESFSGWQRLQTLPPSLRERIHHVYPYRLPSAAPVAQFPREQVWLRSQGLGALEVNIAGRVLFACHAVGEQLAAIENNFSRDYFVEGLEHMLDGTNMTTLYPRTSLGAGQRFLSRGAYVTSLDPDTAVLKLNEAIWLDM